MNSRNLPHLNKLEEKIKDLEEDQKYYIKEIENLLTDFISKYELAVQHELLTLKDENKINFNAYDIAKKIYLESEQGESMTFVKEKNKISEKILSLVNSELL